MNSLPSPASYVEESLILAFPSGLTGKDRLVLALHGYFDDSGTHDQSEVVTVAGYISTAEQWEAFEREWRAALDEYGLEFFRMASFANRAAPYDSWTDQDRRFRFARLVSIINRHAIASIGLCVPKRAFDRIFSKAEKRFVGGAYGLAASGCFIDAARILGPAYPSARIAYVFEAGTLGAGEILKVFQWNYNDREQRPRLKLLSLKFEGKEFTPLQAADILAYELYRQVPHEAGMAVKAGPRIENLHLLADCNLKAWGRLDDTELSKWSKVAALGIKHHGKKV